MELAEEIYWLPTYRSREDLSLPTLEPQDLTSRLSNRSIVTYANMDDELWNHIESARNNSKLVLCMGAGTIDGWIRDMLNATAPQ